MTARRSRLAFLVLAGLALTGLLSPASRGLAQTDEHIAQLAISVTIEESGALLVHERIVYDFGSNERHGIFRDVITRQRYDDDHDRVYAMDDIEVSAESSDTPAPFEVESPGGGITRLRIGDPDRTISGEHIYLVQYRLSGLLNAFEDHDELYWNAVSGWDVPVQDVTVQVVAPADVTEATCFSGPVGASLGCDDFEIESARVTYRQARVLPGEALTVVTALPKGAVTEPVPILEVRHSFERAFTIDPWRMGAALLILAAALAGIARLAWVQGRDRRWRGQSVAALSPAEGDSEVRVPLSGMGAYPVEYTPPDGLRPGLVGTLLDESAHPLDVSATIVDLAARGYLRIEEIEGEGWFGKDDWKFIRLKPSNGLQPYEQLLLDGLFEDSEEQLLSDLRGKFTTRLGVVQDALYQELMDRRWYRRNPKSTRNIWVVVGIGALIASIALEVLVASLTTYALVPLGLIIASIVLLIVHPLMPSRTGTGTAMHRRVLGFRRFILDAETYRARFAEDAGLFYEYLPYAVVFGATKQWARAFEGLAVEAPEWYASSRPFTTLALMDAMGSFSDHSVGSLSYTPGSSGGSGFGGSSGGGGGGGGGGSW